MTRARTPALGTLADMPATQLTALARPDRIGRHSYTVLAQ